MKYQYHTAANRHLTQSGSAQSGYTLIELMIAVAIIGILAATATISYQTQVRKTQIMTIYKEINQYQMPYRTLIDNGAGVTASVGWAFSPAHSLQS